MTASRHVAVVGAGIIGASIAWHLVKAGARVTLVDAAEAGGVATPNSFAWINASWGNPEPYFRLRIRALAEWKRLAAEVALPLAWTGGLLWDLPRPELEAHAAQRARWGYGIRSVGRAEAVRIEPALADPPDFALHVAEEGAVEPQAAARALAEDAIRRGARFLQGTQVTAVEPGRSSARLVLASGTIEADDVVLAAGTATPALAETAGIAVPLEAPPGLIVHSRPHAPLLRGLVLAPRFHMRQTTEGRVIAGSDFTGTDPGADPQATAAALFAEVKAALKGADALVLDFHTVGYRPTPADGFPIVGRPHDTSPVYVAVMHSGITLAAAIGRFVADEIMSGRRDPLLAPYGHDRFA